MKLRTLFVCCALLLSVVPSYGRAAGPNAELMAPVNAVIAALNTGDGSGLRDLYTPDSTVVDEFSPYSWNGATAGSNWFSGFTAYAKQLKLTHPHATAQSVTNYNVTGTRAYIVVPIRFGALIAGKRALEIGTMTVTLQRGSSGWRIVTQSWATNSLTVAK